jgi:predicted nucleic acid-binding protein
VTTSATDRERRAYLDSSAILKLVQNEAETDALRAALSHVSARASSQLALVEVGRRARRFGEPAQAIARAVLDSTSLRPIDAAVIARAVTLRPDGLRALDAIHLATALLMAPELDAFISYDRRLNEAAAAAGLNVESPA